MAYKAVKNFYEGNRFYEIGDAYEEVNQETTQGWLTDGNIVEGDAEEISVGVVPVEAPTTVGGVLPTAPFVNAGSDGLGEPVSQPKASDVEKAAELENNPPSTDSQPTAPTTEVVIQ